MPRIWTGRRSSFRGESAARPADPRSTRRRRRRRHHVDRVVSSVARLLTTGTSGLVLGSSYLSTSLHTSFALDRPLHTVAVVLLLSGLAVVAYETWAAKNRRPNASDRGYVAIPLAEGNGRPSSEETWPLEQRAGGRRRLSKRAIAGLLGLLLFVLSGRIGLFYAVIKDVECTGPTLIAFLPLVLALFHGFRDTSNPRQSPAWSADSPRPSHRDRFVHFFLHGPTRYILPSLLLSISSFLVTLRTSALRSTYICPTATSAASLIPKLQFLGFLVDCIVVLLLYRLIDEGRSQSDHPPADARDTTSINGLIGLTFTASALVIGVAGVTVYSAMPEHREWMLSAPREYLLGLLRLSLMIPLMTLCFLISVSRIIQSLLASANSTGSNVWRPGRSSHSGIFICIYRRFTGSCNERFLFLSTKVHRQPQSLPHSSHHRPRAPTSSRCH